MKVAELTNKLDDILAREKVVKTDGTVVIYRVGGDMNFKIYDANNERHAFLSVEQAYTVKNNPFCEYGKDKQYLVASRLLEVGVADIAHVVVDKVAETISIGIYGRQKGFTPNGVEIHVKGKYLK